MKPDIVHETYFSPYRLGARRARRVLTIYDMIHEKIASSFPHTDKTARNKALAAERADHVICISESTRRDAIEILGLHPDKTSVIYLGFDLMNVDGESAGDLVLPTNKPFLLMSASAAGIRIFSVCLKPTQLHRNLEGYRLICFGGGTLNMDEQKAIHALGMDSSRLCKLG
jgi:glycosyltransferase involved in cell wall biosynthesis